MSKEFKCLGGAVMKFVSILILLSFSAIAQEMDDDLEQKKSSNCHIEINIERTTGIKDNHTIYTTATSKEECNKKSKPHRHNFYPKEVKSKTVEVIYSGK